MLLIAAFLLISWATLREDRLHRERRWVLALDLVVAGLGLAGLVLDLTAQPADALRRWWWGAVPLLAVGMAVSFTQNVRRAIGRPLAPGAAERQGFWLLLGASGAVLLVDLAVLWVNLRFAAEGTRS